MKKNLIILTVAALLGMARPAMAQFCPGCIQNSATPQDAQFNVGTATVRGLMTVGTMTATWGNFTNLNSANLTGNGSAVTALNASSLASGVVAAARLVGAYTGITSVGTLTVGVWQGTVIGTQYGGTGNNWATKTIGHIPYFSTTGGMNTLAPGDAGKILQSNGAAAPSWTSAPQITGANVTALPLANLQTGALPAAITVANANLLTGISASKISGNIAGGAASLTVPLPIGNLAGGTLPTSNAASSITVTGVSAGTYGGPTQMAQFHVNTDGRVDSAAQYLLSVPVANLSTGALPTGVTIGAAAITAGTLAGDVVASSVANSGVAGGTYGDATRTVTQTVGLDGRLTAVSQQLIAINTPQINAGALPANVTVPAASITTGTLSDTVTATKVANSGVAAGTYGGTTQIPQLTVGSDGRVTSATQFTFAALSTSTVASNVDNNWTHSQTMLTGSSWTIHGALSAEAITATSLAGNGDGITSLNPGVLNPGLLPFDVIASSIAFDAVSDPQVAAGANIAQSKIANLTSDLAGKVSRAGDSMSGGLVISTASVANGYVLAVGTVPNSYVLRVTTGSNVVIGQSLFGPDTIPTGLIAGVDLVVFGDGLTSVNSSGGTSTAFIVSNPNVPPVSGAASQLLFNTGKTTSTINAPASIRGIVEDVSNGNGALALTTGLGGTLSEKARIASNGYFGIGTSTPSEKLHVTGRILADSGVQASSGTFVSTVTAGYFVGDGSGLTNLPATLSGGIAGRLPVYNSPSTLANSNWAESAGNFSSTGSLTASSGTFAGEVRASSFNAVGTAFLVNSVTVIDGNRNLSGVLGSFSSTVTASNFIGDGSALTGIVASSVAANTVGSTQIIDDSIINADINSGAAITDTKLAQITTAGKVSGAALTSLSAIPGGAGQVPTANLQPAGSNTQIQYNNSGSFGASGDLFWTNATGILTVAQGTSNSTAGQRILDLKGNTSGSVVGSGPYIGFRSSGNNNNLMKLRTWAFGLTGGGNTRNGLAVETGNGDAGDTAPRFYIDDIGQVGILQSVPAYALDVTGGGRFTSSVTASNFLGGSLALSGGITASSGTFSGGVQASSFNAVGTAYQMNGTTVIDSGLNLVNVGSVTASGPSAFATTVSAGTSFDAPTYLVSGNGLNGANGLLRNVSSVLTVNTGGNWTVKNQSGSGGGSLILSPLSGGTGGTSLLQGGEGTGSGAFLDLSGGAAAGAGGALTLQGGGGNGNGSGGAVTLRSGTGSGTSTGATMTIAAANGSGGGDGGGATFAAGNGSNSGTGGALTIVSGGGGSGGGTGGDATYAAGAGNSGSKGGDLYLQSGNSSSDKGDIYFRGGATAVQGFMNGDTGYWGFGTTAPVEKIQVIGRVDVSSGIQASSATFTGPISASTGIFSGYVQASSFNAVGTAYMVNNVTVIDSNRVVNASAVQINGTSVITSTSPLLAGSGTTGKVALWASASSVTDIGTSIALSGTGNTASGTTSSVVGGVSNTAAGKRSFVGGGTSNTANCPDDGEGGGGNCAILSGSGNSVTGERSAIGNGSGNSATGIGVWVAGINNTASNAGSVVSGGIGNTASGLTSFVGSGSGVQATGQYSMAIGGDSSQATALSSLAAGRFARSNHTGAWIWADNTETSETFPSNVNNEFAARARGGFRFVATSSTMVFTTNGYMTSVTPTPSVACNAGVGVIAAESTNQHGEFVAGAAASSCTITFTTAWPKKPKCFCNDQTAILATRATPTTTTLVCDVVATFGGDTVQYGCLGAP